MHVRLERERVRLVHLAAVRDHELHRRGERLPLEPLGVHVGVSGEEKEVRLLIRDLIAEHVDEWSVDAMGNLIALKKGTGLSDLVANRFLPPWFLDIPEKLASVEAAY